MGPIDSDTIAVMMANQPSAAMEPGEASIEPIALIQRQWRDDDGTDSSGKWSIFLCLLDLFRFEISGR